MGNSTSDSDGRGIVAGIAAIIGAIVDDIGPLGYIACKIPGFRLPSAGCEEVPSRDFKFLPTTEDTRNSTSDFVVAIGEDK